MVVKDPHYYVDGVREGNRRVLAKTITLLESAHPRHEALARAILDQLLPDTGTAVRVGITGVPGVGKSTFIESLGLSLTGRGQRVAVLAVDPSSMKSGGSVMADKTRMERLAGDARAFIRPSPSGGSLGGVARKTRESMLVCEAAGFDVIIVETVGVGQSETVVASMVDFFMVLMLTGAGDELQGIKKGIMELADALVINKADGDNVTRAKEARQVYENALHLLKPSSPNWSPPVLTASALEMKGIEAVWQTVLDHRERLLATGELGQKRRRQALDWMWALVEEGLRHRFYRHERVQEALPKMLKEVEAGITTPTAAAADLLFLLDKGGGD